MNGDLPDYPPRELRIVWETGHPLMIYAEPEGCWDIWEVLAALDEARDAYAVDEEEASL